MEKIDFSQLQRWDFFRSFFLGSLLPIMEVFLMLILIKELKAELWEKTFFVVLSKISFLVGIPLSLYIFSRKFELTRAMFLISILSTLCVLVIPWVDSVIVFLVLTIFISFPYHGIHPMMSEIYNLYPASSRGKRFVSSSMGLFLGSIVFTLIYKMLLPQNAGHGYGESPFLFKEIVDNPYFLILLIASIGILGSGFFFTRFPKVAFSGKRSPSLSTLWKILKKDRFFLYVLIIWNLFGMGNLWLMSYRTNLLVEDRFGFSYDEKTVLFLLTIVPETTYLILNFPFAHLFDRINFIFLRIFFNSLIMFYIFFFFFGDSYMDHLIGGVFFGAFRAGGTVAWRLWINKMVESKEVSLYMTIHVAVTGFRMVFSPILGLFALYHLGPRLSAGISLALVGISILMLIPIISVGKNKFTH